MAPKNQLRFRFFLARTSEPVFTEKKVLGLVSALSCDRLTIRNTSKTRALGSPSGSLECAVCGIIRAGVDQ